MLIGGYRFDLPADWTDVERKLIDGGEFVRAVIGKGLTFSAVVCPGGGEGAIDSYFKTVVTRYEDGELRRFEMDRFGTRYQGWQVTGARSLSTDPDSIACFYGAMVGGDALCFAWLATEGGKSGDVERVEELALTVVFRAIATKVPAQMF